MGSGREEGRVGRRCRERGKLYYEGVEGGRDEGEGAQPTLNPGATILLRGIRELEGRRERWKFTAEELSCFPLF